MKCLRCGSEMNPPYIIEKHTYNVCGGVTLQNISLHKCKICKAEEIEIPAVEELHKKILDMIINKHNEDQELTIDEFIFLIEIKFGFIEEAADSLNISQGEMLDVVSSNSPENKLYRKRLITNTLLPMIVFDIPHISHETKDDPCAHSSLSGWSQSKNSFEYRNYH